jgi:hypothetical protein
MYSPWFTPWRVFFSSSGIHDQHLVLFCVGFYFCTNDTITLWNVEHQCSLVFSHKHDHLLWTSEVPIFVFAPLEVASSPRPVIFSVSPVTALPFLNLGTFVGPCLTLLTSCPYCFLPLYFSPGAWSCFLWSHFLPTLSFQDFGQLAPEISQWPIKEQAGSCHSHWRI